MYNLNDNIICVDTETINFGVSNKFNGKMALSLFVGTKHLFDKFYDVNDVDTMIDEIQKHYLVLA